jgi:hypothetical protein
VKLRTTRARGARALLVLAAALVALAAGAERAWACACGCDVFDVSGRSMYPRGEGGFVWLDYNYQNQHLAWYHSSRAPDYKAGDIRLETHFLTFGLRYMATEDWGVQVEVPYGVRSFLTVDRDGDRVGTTWNDLGDMRVRGIYDGFLDDHSLGVTFGLKLPTGKDDYANPARTVDPDTQLGAGSVDLLVGAFFHREVWSKLSVFTNAQLDVPVFGREHYHPGVELNIALGAYYSFEVTNSITVTPLLQMIEGARTKDTGLESASPVASGYERLLFSPGLEVDVGPVTFYADVEVPIYLYTNGAQLMAPVLFKAMLGFHF